MSMTRSIGVVGPSSWFYMAGLMANRLRDIVGATRITGREVPSGVRLDAMRFFELVTQFVTRRKTPNNPPDNLPASANAYLIATGTITKATPQPPQTPEVEERLREFAEFVTRLTEARELTKDEVELAKQLERFFRQLQRDGQAEAYQSAVTHEAPGDRLRLYSPVLRTTRST